MKEVKISITLSCELPGLAEAHDVANIFTIRLGEQIQNMIQTWQSSHSITNADLKFKTEIQSTQGILDTG